MSNTFQGAYVDDIKLALTASAVSGVHAALLSGPGLGKTTIERAMAKKIFGDKWVFVRVDSTTPPEKVEGVVDIAKLLSDNPKYEIIHDGSAYDPAAKLVIADELGRAMDTTWDKFLDVLNRMDVEPNDAPVVWITSNFMPTSDRTEAMRDRIGIWVWLPDERLDIKAIALAQLRSMQSGLDITDHLPSWADIERIKAMTPGPHAEAAVADVIVTLAHEAEIGTMSQDGMAKENYKFRVNPRRIDQWTRILFRMGAWITGSDDFSIVPTEATRCLQWAYPLTDEKMASQWKTICGAVADPIEAAIDAMKSSAYRRFQEVQRDYGNDKRAASIKFGEVLADAQRDIQLLGDDPRIDEAMMAITQAFSQYVAGKDPFA